MSINGMALKLIDSMYKVSAAAKQTATDKLRKILTRKNKSKNIFNSKPQRIKPAKRRKLTGGGAVRKQNELLTRFSEFITTKIITN